MSFHPYKGPMEVGEKFTFENYISIFTRSYLVNCIIRTIRIAACSSIVAVIMAYPLSYYIAKATSSIRRKILLFTIFFCFFNSTIGRGLSWYLILGSKGIINLILTSLGMQEIRILHSELAVEIGLVYVILPFAVLSIVPSIQKIDPSLRESALILGANEFKTFIHVTLPLSLPGISAALSTCLAITLAAFVIPMILGGGLVDMLSNIIYIRMKAVLNFALGGALSFVLLAASLITMYVIILPLRKVKWT